MKRVKNRENKNVTAVLKQLNKVLDTSGLQMISLPFLGAIPDNVDNPQVLNNTYLFEVVKADNRNVGIVFKSSNFEVVIRWDSHFVEINFPAIPVDTVFREFAACFYNMSGQKYRIRVRGADGNKTFLDMIN